MQVDMTTQPRNYKFSSGCSHRVVWKRLLTRAGRGSADGALEGRTLARSASVARRGRRARAQAVPLPAIAATRARTPVLPLRPAPVN